MPREDERESDGHDPSAELRRKSRSKHRHRSRERHGKRHHSNDGHHSSGSRKHRRHHRSRRSRHKDKADTEDTEDSILERGRKAMRALRELLGYNYELRNEFREVRLGFWFEAECSAKLKASIPKCFLGCTCAVT